MLCYWLKHSSRLILGKNVYSTQLDFLRSLQRTIYFHSAKCEYTYYDYIHWYDTFKVKMALPKCMQMIYVGNYFSSLKLILIKHLNWRQKGFCGISPILYVRYSGFSFKWHKWHSTHALKYSFHVYCCFWGCIMIVCKSKCWLCCYLHCACLCCTCVLNYHDNAAFVQLFCDVSVHEQDG